MINSKESEGERMVRRTSLPMQQAAPRRGFFTRLWMSNPNQPQAPLGPNTPGPNGPNGLNGPNGNRPRPSNSLGWISRILLLVLLVVIGYNIYTWLAGPAQNGPVIQMAYSDFVYYVDNGQVSVVTIQDDGNISGQLLHPVKYDQQDGTVVTSDKFQTFNVTSNETPLINELRAHGVKIYQKQASSSDFWFGLLFNVGIVVLLVIMLLWLSRRATQSQQNIFNFGRSRAKLIMEDRPSTTFADVAAVDEAKSELGEVVEFLKTPGTFQRLGGKIPKGVLLVGPPGTGKTLPARAVAGEAGVPFFSMSGSEFVEVLVGVGASRVRDLFEQAKKASPSIIFIDEIDAVGRQRGASINSNDEREQTLNQLLVEMDGFDTRQAVVVIAATNRPDGLDQALLRPGRFDRRVTVDRPDWNGRLAILKIHTRSVPLDHDVDLTAIARSTTGMVGADLANLVNEAALLAARRNLDRVTQRCFEEALDKILLGAERPLVLSDEDLNVIAYHEGGHALTGLLQEFADPVTKVTIVPRGQALGVTMSTPLDDRYNYSKEYLLAQIVTALGGRAAEQVVFNRVTTGAENDFQKVTALARQMVTRWGMSERLGTISFSERQSPFLAGGDTGAPSDYSEMTAEIVDEEVERIVSSCYKKALELLTTHRATLDRIAQELRRHETIDAKQLQQIMLETGAVPVPSAAGEQATPQELAPPPPIEPPVPPESR